MSYWKDQSEDGRRNFTKNHPDHYYGVTLTAGCWSRRSSRWKISDGVHTAILHSGSAFYASLELDLNKANVVSNIYLYYILLFFFLFVLSCISYLWLVGWAQRGWLGIDSSIIVFVKTSGTMGLTVLHIVFNEASGVFISIDSRIVHTMQTCNIDIGLIDRCLDIFIEKLQIFCNYKELCCSVVCVDTSVLL